jgi:hypothetical protein
MNRPRIVKFLCLLSVFGLLPMLSAAHAGDHQYYSKGGWHHFPSGTYGTSYHYQPTGSNHYDSHYVYYFPSQPQYEYFYSSHPWTRHYKGSDGAVHHQRYRKGYYGRCDYKNHTYEWLSYGHDIGVSKIPNDAFGEPGSMGMVPEREDAPMDLPPPPPPQ